MPAPATTIFKYEKGTKALFVFRLTVWLNPLVRGFPQNLPTDAQTGDNVLVALKILALDIFQQAATLSYQLEQAAAAVVIFFVNLEMLGQVGDPLGQNRDLHLRGTCIAFMGSEISNDFLFFLGSQHFLLLLYDIHVSIYLIDFQRKELCLAHSGTDVKHFIH